MMVYKCPVCGEGMIEDYRDYIEHVLCEAADHCPNMCCYYDYAYGASRELIGYREWVWSYHESPEEWNARRQERLQVIEHFKDYRSWTPII